MSEWIGTRRVTQILGVGSTTIKRWADQGKLPHIRTEGGHRRFRRDAVDRIFQRQATTNKHMATDEWIDLLTEESDILRIRSEVEKLRHRLRDRHSAAQFLDEVMQEIWNRHSGDDEIDASTLIAAGRLSLARTMIEAGVISGETETSQLT